MQPPPNPNPSHLHHHYSHLLPQNANPNPNSHLQIDPNKPYYFSAPGVAPYSSYVPGNVVYAHHQTVDGGSVPVPVPSAYYTDPNAMQNWVVQYGANPYLTGGTIPQNGTQQLLPAITNYTMWTNPTIIQPHGKGTWKRVPKKTKVVQSAWCEVCKVECNTKDVLDQHKMGKKHAKNLEKLKQATTPVVSAVSDKPVIGPQENPGKAKSVSRQKSKKKAAESAEDLEAKRQKVLEGGAAVDAVRTCGICNVVCNSETVFKYHLVGQKHIAMVKKHGSSGATMATATS